MERTVLYIPFDFEDKAINLNRQSPIDIENEVIKEIANELHPPLNHSI